MIQHSSAGKRNSRRTPFRAGVLDVLSLSTDEVREKLKLLNIDTTVCIDQQDLVERLTSALHKQSEGRIAVSTA